MFLNRPLLKWYVRSARFVTWPVAIGATLFALGYPGQLQIVNFALAWVFIFFHSVFVAQAMSSFDSPATAYLYTRGFSRDQLWAHRLVSHLLCVAAAWLPASLVIWLGLRSAFQDYFIQNANYPIFRTDDYSAPFTWLAGYLLAVGVVHYGSIRHAQPTHDRDAGYALAGGYLLAVSIAMSSELPTWQSVTMWIGIIIANVVFLWGSWRLHRSVEVTP